MCFREKGFFICHRRDPQHDNRRTITVFKVAHRDFLRLHDQEFGLKYKTDHTFLVKPGRDSESAMQHVKAALVTLDAEAAQRGRS